MQKLPVFDLVERTAALLEENRPMLLSCEEKIRSAMEELLSPCGESLVTVSGRVKSGASLQEKIFRQSYSA